MSWRKPRATGLPLAAADLARQLDAVLDGDGTRLVTGICGADEPRPGCVAFLEKKPKAPAALAPLAALIVPAGLAADGLPALPLLRAANPRQAFARALAYFFPEPKPVPGVHPAAVVESGAALGQSVSIGPGAVVHHGASIGDDAVLHAGVVVGEQAAIGEGSVLFPNVVVYPGCRLGRRVRVHAGTVIGSDGFGYIWDGSAHRKIPQVGTVIIEDDVELGANCTVDCGTLGPTVIRRGAKLDNLVHLAHNVEVGQHAILVGQVGISGSSKIGDGATLGGQVGVAGHLAIGAGATIAAKSGVTKDVPAGQVMSGFPLRPHAEEKRIKAVTARLPELLRRLIRVEKQLGLEPTDAQGGASVAAGTGSSSAETDAQGGASVAAGTGSSSAATADPTRAEER